MSNIQPNRIQAQPAAAQSAASQSPASQASSQDAAPAQRADGAVLGQEGSVGVAPDRQHASNQLARGRDVLQRSVNQGRIDAAGARELYGRIEDRARDWLGASETGAADEPAGPGFDLAPAEWAAIQTERGRDVLQRSVNQGRIDPAEAREYFSNLKDRARDYEQSQRTE